MASIDYEKLKKRYGEQDGLIKARELELENTLEKARELMGALYRLRALFPPRSDVWIIVPTCQSTLHKIQADIEKVRNEIKFI